MAVFWSMERLAACDWTSSEVPAIDAGTTGTTGVTVSWSIERLAVRVWIGSLDDTAVDEATFTDTLADSGLGITGGIEFLGLSVGRGSMGLEDLSSIGAVPDESEFGSEVSD